MPKNMLEDIKPITKRGSTARSQAPAPRRAEAPLLPREVPFEPAPNKESPRYTLWYIAAACIVALLFSLSFLFERATVTITPKVVPVTFDSGDVFTAQKDTTDEEKIAYTVMTLSSSETMKLPGIEAKSSGTPATGTVILYNTYTTTGYSLAVNTQLVASNGKIYRINSAVTIPGYKKSGTTITPGSTEVKVTAAVPGEDSNITASDLTVKNFAGKPQATKIYGRSKTALSGGISGATYTVAQASVDAAFTELAAKLKASLLAKAKVQVPDGYIFFDGATRFISDESIQVPFSKEKDVPIVLRGTLTAYLIKQDSLVHAITKANVSQYSGEAVTIPSLLSLELSPAAGGVMSPSNDTTFKFVFSGSANILWSIDEKEVALTLAGGKKSQFESAIGTIAGVDKAEVVLKPFWKRTFPKDPSRIKVIVQEGT